ncbi:MAG: hypothetical protein RJA35_20 [Actinomycetota bacterium]|jgi:hypothetical protein
MVYKINPFQQLLWRTPDTLQIGAGGNRQILERLNEGQERLVDALYYGVSPASLPAIAKQVGLTEIEANALIQRLGPLLISAAAPGEDASGDSNGVALAESIRASLDNRKMAASVINARRKIAVHLDSLDPSGLTLMLTLAAAGIGTITTKDFSKVTNEDAASNVYPRALVGHSRHAAARLILESSWPGCRLLHTKRSNDRKTARVDLAILVNHQVTAPVEAGLWRTMEVPVLEIRYQPDGAEVTPVLDGRHGCLVCRDHFKQDADDAHIAMSSQLVTSDLKFDDGGTRLVATGLAVHQALDYFDNPDGAERNLGFRYWREGSGRVEGTVWQAHPSCGCRVDPMQILNEAV